MKTGWYWVHRGNSWCVARYTSHGESGYFQLCGSAEMHVLDDFPKAGMRLGPRIQEPAQ